ncbi:MAG: hypothetical protein ACK4F7_09510, partial [Inhella sp.]
MKRWTPYAFVAPFFVLFLVFGLFPLLFSLWLSVHQWEPSEGLSAMRWVGLENYAFGLTDPWFIDALVAAGFDRGGMQVTADTPTLHQRKAEARAWFETLRDRIHAGFEALEDAAPADLFPGEPGRFVRTPWERPEGGGGVMG